MKMIEVRNEADFTDYIDSFLNRVESDDLEFKSAAGGFPGSFWDTYLANVATSEANVATSEPNVATSKPNVATSEPNVATSEPNVATSEINPKKRMSFDELKNTICQICSEWMFIDEIANILKRDKAYLRNHILPKLLDYGCLEMMFPGVPNHPRQKYRATKEEV